MGTSTVLMFVGWIIVISAIGFGLFRVTGFFAAKTSDLTEQIDEIIPQSPTSSNRQQYETPKCPTSCDDTNPCTNDFCDATTDYECVNDPVNGTNTSGCYGSPSTCQSNLCIEGKCTKVTSPNCCGNNKCEIKETCYNCPSDCGECVPLNEPSVTYQTPPDQPNPSPQPSSPSPAPNLSSNELQIDIEFEDDPVVRGNDQTIIITLTDGDDVVENVTISSVITYASGTKQTFAGSTDSDGSYSYTWKIGGNSKTGTFTVKVDASKEKYQNTTTTSSFEVISAG